MFHFRTLDVYRCAIAFLPVAYSMAITARGSALECAAVLDAMTVLDVAHDRIGEGDALLLRIVSMLTKMIG